METSTRDFHEFALEWEPTELRWYLDGQLYATQTNWYSSGQPFPAPFNERFHLLMNVAVGGNFPGNPDGSTVFPQQMVVDYVRVYRDLTTCEIVYDSMDHGAPFSNGWFFFNGSVGGGGIGGNTTDLPPVQGGTASLQTAWGSGGASGFMGGYGRSRDMDLSAFTHFDFWINPDAGQAYNLEINLQDDDNGDGVISIGADDEFQKVIQVGGTGADVISGSGWQKVSIPFSEFADDNSYYNGGNGVFDPVEVSSGGNGMLINVVVAIINQSGADISYRMDRWAFTSRTSSIGGRVWDDLNQDGQQNAGEPGIEGVLVELVDPDSGALESTTTDAGGNYQFDALLTGSFEVGVDPTTIPPGYEPTSDPDGTSTPGKCVLTLACDTAIGDGDFGFSSIATDAPPSGTRLDRLYAATPNPFNPSTVLRFDLSAAGVVSLSIFDAAGRLVRVLESGEWPAGSYETTWNGRDDSGRQCGEWRLLRHSPDAERSRCDPDGSAQIRDPIIQ